MPHHRLTATGPEGVDVVDAVAAGEHRGDHRHRLIARVSRTGRPAQVDGLVDQVLDPKLLGERRGEQEPGVGDQASVVEGHVEPVEGVRDLHPTGALRGGKSAG